MSKPYLSHDELRRFLRNLPKLVPMTEGEESRVFGNDDFILRVNEDIEGFRKDDFVYRTFAGVGLPIPEIIETGHLADGNAFCISRRAKGHTLQDLSAEELPFVLDAVARVMAAIAECRPATHSGFGRFDATGVAPHVSWRDFLLHPVTLDWKDAKLDGDVHHLLELLLELTKSCPEHRALVHGDFGSNNVLTDGTEITAVIDWSEALYGDPLYDLANILFWRPWLACMELQARWFEAHRPELLKQAARLRCYQLHIGLGQVWACGFAGQDSDRNWALARCAEIARSG
jgi:hygromycin-B 4-O-kinase